MIKTAKNGAQPLPSHQGEGQVRDNCKKLLTFATSF